MFAKPPVSHQLYKRGIAIWDDVRWCHEPPLKGHSRNDEIKPRSLEKKNRFFPHDESCQNVVSCYWDHGMSWEDSAANLHKFMSLNWSPPKKRLPKAWLVGNGSERWNIHPESPGFEDCLSPFLRNPGKTGTQKNATKETTGEDTGAFGATKAKYINGWPQPQLDLRPKLHRPSQPTQRVPPRCFHLQVVKYRSKVSQWYDWYNARHFCKVENPDMSQTYCWTIKIHLIEEFRHSPVELGSLSHHVQGFINPRWCRIFSILQGSKTRSSQP